MNIKKTINWLTSFIINYNICPFAKREHEKNSIHYVVVEPTLIHHCLEVIFTECQRLDNQLDIETTLIIFPTQFMQFDDYLDFVAMAESLLIDQHYQGVYQLASFHPDYYFEGEKINDPANYTNRSPYPMLHLIRESSLEKALKSYSHPELIPERNIQLLRKMGLDKIQSTLKNL